MCGGRSDDSVSRYKRKLYSSIPKTFKRNPSGGMNEGQGSVNFSTYSGSAGGMNEGQGSVNFNTISGSSSLMTVLHTAHQPSKSKHQLFQ